MKICVVGGGSTYTPELIDGLLRRRDQLPISEIHLVDIDEERLSVLGPLAQRMVEHAGGGVAIRYGTDQVFGTKADRPIRVGNARPRRGDVEESLYLNALRGPNGEALSYERLGSCCPFPTQNGFQGRGLLDVFRVSGLPEGKSVLR